MQYGIMFKHEGRDIVVKAPDRAAANAVAKALCVQYKVKVEVFFGQALVNRLVPERAK